MASLKRRYKVVAIPSGVERFIKNGETFVRVPVRGGNAVACRVMPDGLHCRKPLAAWYGKYRNQRGTVRNVKLTTDKAVSQAMLAELVKKARRQRLGLHDPEEDHAHRPLPEHLEDYATMMRGKGDTPEHVHQTCQRIRALFDGCGFVFLSEMDAVTASKWVTGLRENGDTVSLAPGRLEFAPNEVAAILGVSGQSVRANTKRHGLKATGEGKARRYPRATVEALIQLSQRGASPQTVNHHLRAVRGFLRWMVRNRRIATNPLDTLELIGVEAEVRRQRRELTVVQVVELLEATRASVRTFRTLTGEDRYFLYLIALTVGFRAGALASLTPESFALDTTPPTVTLAAIRNKSRTLKVVPLTTNVTEQLRPFLATKLTDQLVWGGPWAKDHKGALMLRGDLEAANIPYVLPANDGTPSYVDFHALRHSCLTILGQSGVDLRTLQELAGHSKPELTARYTHCGLNDLAEAVGKFPSVDRSAKVTPKVTPTSRISLHLDGFAHLLPVAHLPGGLHIYSLVKNVYDSLIYTQFSISY